MHQPYAAARLLATACVTLADDTQIAAALQVYDQIPTRDDVPRSRAAAAICAALARMGDIVQATHVRACVTDSYHRAETGIAIGRAPPCG